MSRKKVPEVPSKTSPPKKRTFARKGAKAQSKTTAGGATKRAVSGAITKSPQDFSPTLGELDLHLFGEGKHERAYEKLGAHVATHEGATGVTFAVWAPNAKSVSVVGNFNEWNGTKHPMRRLGSSGVWELFIPGLREGELYKYEIKAGRQKFLKADPYAFMMEVPPSTSSIIVNSKYKFRDRTWMRKRKNRQAWREPLTIYEVHLGSWRRITEDGNRSLTYREMAVLLADYAV
jgi:1,4-alpha-glucan branching enzyme